MAPCKGVGGGVVGVVGGGVGGGVVGVVGVVVSMGVGDSMGVVGTPSSLRSVTSAGGA